MTTRWTIALLVCLLPASALTLPAPQAITPEVTAAPTPASPAPRVVGVTNQNRDARALRTPADERDEQAYRHQLKDVLKVKVRDLQAWRQVPANAALPLHLYLAGTELRNVTVEPTSPEPAEPGDTADTSWLRVVLEIDDGNQDNRRAWVQVLRAAMRRPDRRLELTVGPSGAPFPSDVRPDLAPVPPSATPLADPRVFALDVFPWYTAFVGIFLLLVVLLIVMLGKRSNLLRDTSGTNLPYSLAKHQMAVWFVVVVGSYLYVWLITGTFASISTTALTLVGISGATGLVAVAMDTNKRAVAQKVAAALNGERAALQDALDGPSGLRAQLAAVALGSPQSVELIASITPKSARLHEIPTLVGLARDGRHTRQFWLRDLVSDDNGVSFHRLQMAVWTIVLAIVFIRAVWVDILMPEFDATLLGLLGLSSGTYLGFKFPETPK